MSNINNNKKALAEKLKNYLNSPKYVAIPDLIRDGDYSPDLSYVDGEWIRTNRKFIDWEKGLNLIYDNQLEPSDWKEIIDLIKKRNKEREVNYQAKQKKIEDKVNSQPGLYYYYGSGSKNDRGNTSIRYGDKQGRYFDLWGSENGRSFYLSINARHPVLNNFPYGKHGYYLIETDKPIERNDGVVRPWSSGGESNASNFHKWVEVGDQITITPYQVEESKEPKKWKEELRPKSEYDGCSICHKKIFLKNSEGNFYAVKRYHGREWEKVGEMWICQSCYPAKEQEFLQNYAVVVKHFDQGKDKEVGLDLIKMGWVDCYAGHKDQNGKVLQQQNCSHCQPWKQHQVSNSEREKILTLLTQIFQKYNIKKIAFENGELVITYNNNKTVIDNSEYQQLVKDSLQKLDKNELTSQELNINSSSNSTQQPTTPNGSKVWLIIGGSVILVTFGIVIGLLLRRNKNKKH